MNEASLNDLYRSAVEAFPGTRKRQHAVDPVRITDIAWTPFVGLRTLLVRGTAQNEGREYHPIILFKGVVYGAGVPLVSAGREYLLERLSREENDVLVRCGCGDFKWRFNYYDHVDESLYGRVRAPYHGSGAMANPQEMPGMCKHLIKLMTALRDAGLFR